jgi:hypothetical protein
MEGTGCGVLVTDVDADGTAVADIWRHLAGTR